MRVVGLSIIVVLLLAFAVSAVDIDPKLLQELEKNGTARVIVKLKDPVVTVPQPAARSFINSRSLRVAAVQDNSGIKKQEIKQAQDKVLARVKDQDFQLKHKLENSNVLTGELTAKGLANLNNNEIESITLDIPVSINLADSLPLINGDLVHDLQVDGFPLTGKGQTICVIDTGIDYTHPALSGCNPVTYNFTGTPELLSTAIESAHPYADNTDITFKINKTGYSNIAVHFVNLSLENKGVYDTTDRVIVYDGNNQTIAIYNGTGNDFWTPYAEGDTIYVRFISDPSVTDYGFYIDQIANGTTNTTVDWSSCSKIEGGWDAYNSDNNPLDDNGHGTHVAGILISDDSTYRGVAPDAHLAVVKALDSAGDGYLSDFDFGIDWCTSKKELYNISVISISVGLFNGNTFNSACDSQYSSTANAINTAVAKNISVVVASGNDAVSNGISAPACITNATSVGATTKGDIIASYSDSANILDLLAPGSSITSTKLGGGFVSFSGTSIATPHVAAAFAVLSQYWQEVYHTEITPAERLNKFKLTGKEILDSRNNLYFPRIDLLKAIQPYISFTASSVANATATTATTVLINISSDVPLSSAELELTYPNFTKENFTLLSNNQTNFQLDLTLVEYGDYSYVVYGNDSVTLGLSEERMLTKNNLITISYPQENQSFNSVFSLNISLSSENLTSSSYNITDQTGQVIQSAANLNLAADDFIWSDLVNVSNSSYSDGEYILNVVVNNLAGETDQESLTFIVDKTPPSLSVLNVSPAAIYKNSNITFTINISDLNLNLSAIYFHSNFSGTLESYPMTINLADTYSYTLANDSGLTSGLNVSYHFSAADLAGNLAETENYSFLVSNHAPENVAINLSDNIFEVGSAIIFTASAVDLDEEPLGYNWDFADGTTSNSQTISHIYEQTGTYNITLNVSDLINQDSTNTLVTIVDTQPPVLQSISYDPSVHIESDNNQTVTVNVFDYSGVSSVTLTTNTTINFSCSTNLTSSLCSFILGNLTLGGYQFYLNFTDNISHSNGTINYSFTVTSCFDGSKNGDETGVDCGGSCSLVCPAEPSDSSSSSGSSSGGSSSGGGGGSSNSATQETVATAASSTSPAENPEETAPAGEFSLADEELSPVNPSYELPLSLVKGEFVTLKLDYPDLPVKELNLKGNDNLPVTVKFNSYDRAPEGVLPIKNSFKYIEITPDVGNEKIADANLVFTVSREWLETNNFVPAAVKLKVFEGGKWKDVKTKEPSKDALTGSVIADDSANLYYQATIPHFSFYVITGDTEAPLKWYHKIVPKNFSTQEYFLAAMLIFIVILLVVYLVVKDRDE